MEKITKQNLIIEKSLVLLYADKEMYRIFLPSLYNKYPEPRTPREGVGELHTPKKRTRIIRDEMIKIHNEYFPSTKKPTLKMAEQIWELYLHEITYVDRTGHRGEFRCAMDTVQECKADEFCGINTGFNKKRGMVHACLKKIATSTWNSGNQQFSGTITYIREYFDHVAPEFGNYSSCFNKSRQYGGVTSSVEVNPHLSLGVTLDSGEKVWFRTPCAIISTTSFSCPAGSGSCPPHIDKTNNWLKIEVVTEGDNPCNETYKATIESAVTVGQAITFTARRSNKVGNHGEKLTHAKKGA